MPKYNFICEGCQASVHKYVSLDKEKIDCVSCGKVMHRQFPKINGQQVTELVDPITGVTWQQDQAEIMKHRKQEHFWEHEVPKLVQTYSVETCLENGWLVYNEKGELVIGKAPSKR